MRKRKIIKCAPCNRPIRPHKKVPTVQCALQAFHNEKIPTSQGSPHSAALSLHIKAGCGWKLLKFYKLTLSPGALRALIHQKGTRHHKHILNLLWHIHSCWNWGHMTLFIIFFSFVLHKGSDLIIILIIIVLIIQGIDLPFDLRPIHIQLNR